jgi:hypothetical protein
MSLSIGLFWLTVVTIQFTLLAITTYEGDVSCEINSIDISYQFTNTSLECFPIEFDSALDPCDTQTQGYCYDGSNVTILPYHNQVFFFTPPCLDTFPNVSVVNLEHTQFHCFSKVDLRKAATQLHEGHASQESLVWFIVFVILATLTSILPWSNGCSISIVGIFHLGHKF